MTLGSKRPRKKPAGPKPVTATYLRNAAMHYLSAHAASIAMVRQVLERRAKRRLMVRELEPETQRQIEATLAALGEVGLLDDAQFAVGRAATLAGRGLSKRRISEGLRQKGVAAETIAKTVGNDLDELELARRFVERKRLGSFRRLGMTPESRRKDLAALARAGFSFAIASRALDENEGE